ncbi:hypothetical protein FJT64_013706 [Amphibalanus amphitrite]|uniref:Neuropeptide F n=1 Tax=Amphibalanus amphitrite TaxID=1232801 RepID=I3VNA1_AMPAM|nr:neuropeptide F-like [Amphibalanus amphitrite]XP_043233550.1 neuropeptide F-like [Amphibalanus amphitrite]AFK81938.1 neuropeptide F [Amphibalanus amphitrite]KAF0287873.1 hypothetical protein FJT64_013706 [Amphibalanus amphitrite]
MRDSMRLALALLLTALLVLPRHHVTASEPRDLRSAGSGEMLSGDIDNYLSELKDFYTKVGRPRFGKRSTRVRRWRTVASLGDVIHELRF